jgi:hypothetical protein
MLNFRSMNSSTCLLVSSSQCLGYLFVRPTLMQKQHCLTITGTPVFLYTMPLA